MLISIDVICLEELWKIMNNYHEDSPSPDRDLNLLPSVYEGVLPIRL
jgi:hypothetical protein